MATDTAINKAMKDYEKACLKKKIETSAEDLCEGLPRPFFDFLQYCRFVSWEAKPDYAYLKNLFKCLFDDLKYEFDGEFDWVVKRRQLDEMQR